MKTSLLVIAAFLLGSLTAVGAVTRFTPTTPGHKLPATEAIYFRDASGRCLRLQPTLGDDGALVVLVESPAACATREAPVRSTDRRR